MTAPCASPAGVLWAREPLRVDPELVRRFDRSGPRYTSYPTALEFHPEVGEAAYLEHLAAAAQSQAGEPLSLYVHIPFCEKLCTFCACHFIVTPRREVARTYLSYLRREVELLAARLPERRTLAQLQWGGGTPTYLSPEEMGELFAALGAHFVLAPGAEVAIEIDPRFTTLGHLEALRRLGFNRLSLGVQDFTPAVQAAIGRGQTLAQTRDLVTAARRLGFGEGINIDLVYGLPHQDAESFESNLDRLLELRPERVAMYSFAYVPWARPHQKRLDANALPSPRLKLALYLAAVERLLAAGYEAIGMDHFALPSDVLARAARADRLQRNFMGYTVKAASAMVALGVSGVGELAGAFFQNHRKLPAYYAALDAGRLPIERGYRLDADDLVRQFVIRRLLCHFAIDKAEVKGRFGVDFDHYFAGSLAALAEPGGAYEAGLVTDEGHQLRVTATGRLFVRNLCMAFDRYLGARSGGGRPAYSRTV